jgi:hypothetical protein
MKNLGSCDTSQGKKDVENAIKKNEKSLYRKYNLLNSGAM